MNLTTSTEKTTHMNKGFEGFGIHEGAICRVRKKDLGMEIL